MKLAEVSGAVRDRLRADGLAEGFGLSDDRRSVQQVIEAVASRKAQ